MEIQRSRKIEFTNMEQISNYIFEHPDLFCVIGFMSKDNVRKIILYYSPEIFIVACGNKFFLTNRQGEVYNIENHNNNILNQFIRHKEFF